MSKELVGSSPPASDCEPPEWMDDIMSSSSKSLSSSLMSEVTRLALVECVGEVRSEAMGDPWGVEAPEARPDLMALREVVLPLPLRALTLAWFIILAEVRDDEGLQGVV